MFLQFISFFFLTWSIGSIFIPNLVIDCIAAVIQILHKSIFPNIIQIQYYQLKLESGHFEINIKNIGTDMHVL